METETVFEQLIFATVRLETVESDGGRGVGTGFVFAHEDELGPSRWIVSNRHVVEGVAECAFDIARGEGGKPLLGQSVHVDVTDIAEVWHFHPDPTVDVAVMSIAGALEQAAEKSIEIFFKAIPSTAIPTADQRRELDVIEEVYFIGYPSGLYDPHSLVPVVRRGTTATPLQVDYLGRPIFLVDGSVFPGSSGSPVVIANQGSYSNRHGIVLSPRMHLLGIIAKAAFREQEGGIEFREIPTRLVPHVTTKEMIDLGVVYKAETIVETIDDVLRRHDRSESKAVPAPDRVHDS